MLQESFTQPEPLHQLSGDELVKIIDRCEQAIADGSAALAEYEAFVLAQRELARRTWS